MFYTVEEVENDISDYEQVGVKLPALQGGFLKLYSDEKERSSGETAIDDLKKEIDEYCNTNFVPEWIIKDNPDPNKFVVYHTAGSHSVPGSKIGEYTPNKLGFLSDEQLKEIFTIDYGLIIVLYIPNKQCMYFNRILN